MPIPHTLPLFGIFGSDITAAGVRAQLDALPSDTPIRATINSDGGSVAEAVAIYNTLRTWSGGVETEIVGWALSAAVIPAMAGQRRRAHIASMLMVHAPWTPQGGNAQQLRDNATTLDSVADGLRAVFRCTSQSDAVIASWLDGQDHWFTAAEAMALGLVDEVIDMGVNAATLMNINACRHPIPPNVQARFNAMPAPISSPAPSPTAEAIRAEAIRAEGQRRDDIRGHFEAFATRTDIRAELHALQLRCESDVSCTPATAGQHILALLARGVTSAAGGGPRIDVGGGADTDTREFLAAATDALMMRAGLRVDEPHPAVRDVRGMSVVTMAARMLSMRGISTETMSPGQILAKGMSTSDLPSLLSEVAGKSLRNSYAEAPVTFGEWTSEREVADFKPQTLVALSEAPGLLLVPELTEYKAGSLKDSESAFEVKTYGRVLYISRQALVNDDLKALTNVPAAFGASARRLEADLVYGRLTSNPVLGDGKALFHAHHGNLAPVNASPTISSLATARTAMRKQRDIAGEQYIDPRPRFIIVPVALETSVEQLLVGLKDPDAYGKDRPNLEWVRGLQLVADPRLDAASETAWYLAADPQQIEGIVRAYLVGEGRPFLEENAEFERDAFGTKARLDVGVGVVDFRGLYKNSGA